MIGNERGAQVKRIDWELWAPRVVAKEISAREAARQIGCAESAVRKAVANWRKRNVSQIAIEAKTRAKLERPLIATAQTVAEVEDALADRAARIVGLHRHRIGRAMDIVDALTCDLTTSVVERTRLVKLLELNGLSADQVRDLLGGVMSTSEQAKAVGTLGATLRTLIGLERQAFELPARVDSDGNGKGKGKGKQGSDPYSDIADMLKGIDGADTGLPTAAGAATG